MTSTNLGFWLTFAAVLLVFWLLLGCTRDFSEQDRAYCLNEGYAQGSEAHAICRMMLVQHRQNERAMAISTINAMPGRTSAPVCAHYRCY